MAAPLPTLRKKLAKQKRRRDRQARKWRKTKKAGHGKAAKAAARAVRKIKRAIKEIQKALRMRPSPNFRWREFDCNDGRRFPRSAKPGIRKLCREVLEPVRAKHGAVSITSAYRHAAYNAAVGGEPNSYHIYDLRNGESPAVDFTCAKGSPQDWADTAAKHGADGIGVYTGLGFTHIDQRGYDSRWYG